MSEVAEPEAWKDGLQKETGHAYFQKEITFYCIQKSEGKCDQKRKSFSCDLAAVVVVALIMKALETIVEALTFLSFLFHL